MSGMIEIASALMSPEPVSDLESHVRERLRPWSLALDEEFGHVLDGDSFSNIRYELVGPEELEDRPWHVAEHACPFAGELVGYVLWSYPDSVYSFEIETFALALLKEGRGVTARLDDDRFFEAVKLRRLDLLSIVGKYGFDDGADLLTREEGPYSRYVLEEVHAAIAAAGCSAAHLSWADTCHNPLRWSSFLPEGSERSSPALWGPDGRLCDPYEALKGRQVELWAYDPAPLRDARFWGLRDARPRPPEEAG